MGVTGCGATPMAAWKDMWALYTETVSGKMGNMFLGRPRD